MERKSPVYDFLRESYKNRRPLLFILIDPDKIHPSEVPGFVAFADAAGVDGFLVGGSLCMYPQFEKTIGAAKLATMKPVVIFPGGIHQVSGEADAILFISLLSGRNAEHLIGQHVLAAPIIRNLDIEPISTGYMIIESNRMTTTEFMSNSKPLPREKPEIAAAHAIAGEMLGMKILYLEAGSGAAQSVPNEMITLVSQLVEIPLIVGGGIRSPEAAAEKIRAGASIVIIGNHFEPEHHRSQLKSFTEAVHAALDNTIIEV